MTTATLVPVPTTGASADVLDSMSRVWHSNPDNLSPGHCAACIAASTDLAYELRVEGVQADMEEAFDAYYELGGYKPDPIVSIEPNPEALPVAAVAPQPVPSNSRTWCTIGARIVEFFHSSTHRLVGADGELVWDRYTRHKVRARFCRLRDEVASALLGVTPTEVADDESESIIDEVFGPEVALGS